MKNTIRLSALVIGAMMLSSVSFAGHPGQTGQAAKNKVKKAVVGVADKTVDKVADKGLKAAAKVTGKQTHAHVKGHYKGDQHVKGHFRKLAKPIKQEGLAQKAKKTAIKAGDSVQNATVDAGMAAKKKITGKQGKTFVKGHFKKDGSHVNGHFRKIDGKKAR